MTREEMLVEIEEYRKNGHAIGITGSGQDWRCEFDNEVGKGETPIAAYLAAKSLRDPDL